MPYNVGQLDSMLRRRVIGPLLIIAGLVVGASSVVGVVLLVLALYVVVTGAVGSDPLYRLARLDSRKRA